VGRSGGRVGWKGGRMAGSLRCEKEAAVRAMLWWSSGMGN
jgi:hypothetical protein